MDRSPSPVLRRPLARAIGSALASFGLVAPFLPQGLEAATMSAVLNAAANVTQPDFSPTDAGPAEDRGTARRIVLSVNASLGGALLEHAWYRSGQLPPTMVVAVALVVASLGIALRAWSVRTLARHFTWHVTILDDHRLVTTGPYRIFRHPSYVGAFVAYTALPVAFGAWLCALIAIPLLASAFRARIALEETRLREHFGEEWSSFAARVGPTWPLV